MSLQGLSGFTLLIGIVVGSVFYMVSLAVVIGIVYSCIVMPITRDHLRRQLLSEDDYKKYEDTLANYDHVLRARERSSNGNREEF